MPEQNFSIQDVMALMAKMNEQQMALIEKLSADNRAMVKELRSPTPEQLSAKKLEDDRIARHQKERLELAMAQETAKANLKRNCPHVMDGGRDPQKRHLWRGQPHTPPNRKPFFVATCSGCLTQIGPILCDLVNSEMVREGCQLHLYPLDIEMLEDWKRKSDAILHEAALAA